MHFICCVVLPNIYSDYWYLTTTSEVIRGFSIVDSIIVLFNLVFACLEFPIYEGRFGLGAS